MSRLSKISSHRPFNQQIVLDLWIQMFRCPVTHSQREISHAQPWLSERRLQTMMSDPKWAPFSVMIMRMIP